jgi:hypothetical protein
MISSPGGFLLLSLLAATKPVPRPGPTPPPTVAGVVTTFTIGATAPVEKVKSAEARALVGQKAPVELRAMFAQDLTRLEVVSRDFVLPAGTVLLHKAGDRYYVIADPRSKTYVVMDAGVLMEALEGAAGVANSNYGGKVLHTDEKKMIAGLPARRSVLNVRYASSIPFENDRILVQRVAAVEVWHTPELPAGAALEHLFLKFREDGTGAIRKELTREVGFPLEIDFAVRNEGAKGDAVQPGSFHLEVKQVAQEKKLNSSLFTLPPPGYAEVKKNPFAGK